MHNIPLYGCSLAYQMDLYLPLFAVKNNAANLQIRAEADVAGFPQCPVFPFTHTREVYEGCTSQPPLQLGGAM